jgi:hypothetical protein
VQAVWSLLILGGASLVIRNACVRTRFFLSDFCIEFAINGCNNADFHLLANWQNYCHLEMERRLGKPAIRKT